RLGPFRWLLLNWLEPVIDARRKTMETIPANLCTAKRRGGEGNRMPCHLQRLSEGGEGAPMTGADLAREQHAHGGHLTSGGAAACAAAPTIGKTSLWKGVWIEDIPAMYTWDEPLATAWWGVSGRD